MDGPTIFVLVCICVAALALSLSEDGMPSRGVTADPRSRTWTSSLSTVQAGIALGTVGQRIGYSLDRDQRPGLTVLADSVMAASYGQLFPVTLTSSGTGTVVRIGISAKDPTLALTDAVRERRLETLARITRAVFVAAEADAEPRPQDRNTV